MFDISGPFIDHSCLVLCREEKFSSGPSFQTISASGLNAALAHYRYFRKKNFLAIPVYEQWGVGREEVMLWNLSPYLNFEAFSTVGAGCGEWVPVSRLGGLLRIKRPE